MGRVFIYSGELNVAITIANGYRKNLFFMLSYASIGEEDTSFQSIFAGD